MDYEKKYKVALDWMRDVYPTLEGAAKEDAEHYFPELKDKDNDDDRIRKEIIQYIKTGTYHKDWIAWLEKQGAKVSAIEGFKSEFERQVSYLIASAINKEHEYNQGYVKWTANALLNYARYELEKQDEQKPADKVEPKFKVGDWVFIEEVKGYKQGAFQIKSIDEFGYNFDEYHIIPFMYEELLSKWTIQDEKDGDVLANDNSVFIYSKVLYNKPYAYCGIDKFGVFKDNCLKYDWSNSIDNIRPATREQRDLLFKKMKESGYEWDAEKKELKKIERKHTGKVEPIVVKDFNSVFSREQIEEIDKRIEKSQRLYNAKLRDAMRKVEDFPMTD